MSGFSHYYFSTSHRCITLQVCQGSVIITSVLHIGVSPSRYVRVQSLLLQYFTSVYHPPGMSGFSHYYFSTSHRCITLQVCQGSVIITSVLHIGVSPSRYVRVQSLLLQYFHIDVSPSRYVRVQSLLLQYFTSVYHPPGMRVHHYYFSTSHRCITLQVCQGSVIITSVLSHRCITLQVCQGSVIITSVLHIGVSPSRYVRVQSLLLQYSHRCITLQVCQGSVIITSVLHIGVSPSRYVRVQSLLLQYFTSVYHPPGMSGFSHYYFSTEVSHRCITLQVCQGSVIITSVLHIGVSPSRYVRVQSLLLQYFTSVYHPPGMSGFSHYYFSTFTSVYHPPGMSGFSHYYFSTSHRCITLQVCQGSVIITSVLSGFTLKYFSITLQVCQGSVIITSVLHIDVSPSRYVRVQSLLLQYFTSMYHPPGMSGFSHYYFSTSHRCITLQVCQGSVIITSVLHIGVSPSRYVRVQSLLLQYFHIGVSPSRYVRVQSLLLQYFTSVYHPPGMSGFSHYYFSTSHRCITLQVCQGSVIITSVLHIDVSPSRYVRVQSLLLQYFHIGVSPSRYVRVQSLLLQYFTSVYHPPGMSGFSHYYFSTSHRCITLQVCQGSVIITSVLHIDVSPSRYVRVQSLLLQYFTSMYHPPGMSGFSHYCFSTSHRCITLQVCQGSVIITSVFSHRCITLQVCQGSVIITSVLSHRCITLQVCQGSVIITSVLSHRCITLQVCQGSVIITHIMYQVCQGSHQVYHPPGMSGFSHYYFSTSHRCITLQVCQGSVIVTSVH